MMGVGLGSKTLVVVMRVMRAQVMDINSKDVCLTLTSGGCNALNLLLHGAAEVRCPLRTCTLTMQLGSVGQRPAPSTAARQQNGQTTGRVLMAIRLAHVWGCARSTVRTVHRWCLWTATRPSRRCWSSRRWPSSSWTLTTRGSCLARACTRTLRRFTRRG